MAAIIGDTPPRGQSQQIPYVTDEVVAAAKQAKATANELLDATKAHSNVPYVKNIRDTVNSVVPVVCDVEAGQPTAEYIGILLHKRKEMQELEESIRGGSIPVKPEDEDGATLAINLWQRFSLAFMGVLFYFEEGLSPEQR